MASISKQRMAVDRNDEIIAMPRNSRCRVAAPTEQDRRSFLQASLFGGISPSAIAGLFHARLTGGLRYIKPQLILPDGLIFRICVKYSNQK
jgi:hypothetical protein